MDWERAVIASDMNPGQKLTALAYKTFANAEGRDIWPSHQAVAERVNRDIRSVERDAPKVVKAGFLVKVAPAIPRKRGAVYRLAIPTQLTDRTVGESELGGHDSPTTLVRLTDSSGGLTDSFGSNSPTELSDNHSRTIPKNHARTMPPDRASPDGAGDDVDGPHGSTR